MSRSDTDADSTLIHVNRPMYEASSHIDIMTAVSLTHTLTARQRGLVHAQARIRLRRRHKELQTSHLCPFGLLLRIKTPPSTLTLCFPLAQKNGAIRVSYEIQSSGMIYLDVPEENILKNPQQHNASRRW